MPSLKTRESIQEACYGFPYHHIPTIENGRFSETRVLKWGYEYISYVDFVLNLIRSIEFGALLDVGCGDGKFLYEASRRFPAKRLVGLDCSEQAVRYACAMNPGVQYVCGDIGSGMLSLGRFDVVTLIETLEHIPPEGIRQFCQGLHQHLEPGGSLVITVPSVNVRLNHKHFQHFDLQSLSQAIQPFFRISNCYYINRISVWTRLVEKLLVNSLFILNERWLVNRIYSLYANHLLSAQETDARRICAVYIRES